MKLQWAGEEHVYPANARLSVFELAEGAARVELQLGSITLRFPRVDPKELAIAGTHRLTGPLAGGHTLDVAVGEELYSALDGKVSVSDFSGGHIKGKLEASIPFDAPFPDGREASQVTGDFDAFPALFKCWLATKGTVEGGGITPDNGEPSWAGAPLEHPFCAQFLSMDAAR